MSYQLESWEGTDYLGQCVLGRGLAASRLGRLASVTKCVMYTVQCEGCSVLPAKDAYIAVETELVKLKCYL